MAGNRPMTAPGRWLELRPGDEALAEIPTADAELVELREERELLLRFRSLSPQKQKLMMEVLDVFIGPRGRS